MKIIEIFQKIYTLMEYLVIELLKILEMIIITQKNQIMTKKGDYEIEL